MSYNGWKNYETWNVWLWLTNDRPLYEAMLNYVEQYGDQVSYHGFLTHAGFTPDQKTPDDVKWWDENLDIQELDEAVKEFFVNWQNSR